MRAPIVKLLLLVVGLALILPVMPGTAVASPAEKAAVEQAPPPPHVRRRRRRRPPPPPPPPHVRRRVIRTEPRHQYTPQPRPRQPIAEPRTSVYFGLGPVANFIVESTDQVSKELDTGGGLEMFFGFRFNQFAALELGGLFTFHGTQNRGIETGILNGFTGDLKVFFLPSSRRIEPFFQIGAGVYLLARDNWIDNELTGGGFQVGTGVDIRLNRTVAIGTRFLYRGIFLDNSEAFYWSGAPYENTFLSGFTLSANIQLHF